MIISFSVANWMSFRDRVTLSMVASRERQHGERVARLGRYQLRALPVMALYGGNASGKTNLFKALSFAKTQVVEGSRPGARIPVIPFLLDKNRAQQPARFEFEILIDEAVYAFSFSVTREKVLEERLVRVGSTSERTLYDRRDRDIKFDDSLEGEQRRFLNFAFRGTRDNQLLLTNSISQNVQNFRPIHDWFKDTLQIITPDTRFGQPSFHTSSSVAMKMSEMLPNYDTGISRMDSERVPVEYIQLPEPVENKLQELDEGESVHLAGPSKEYFKMTRENGKLIASKCVTVHRTDDAEIPFDLTQESDGSQRLIDLLPAFIDLSSGASARVYVVDEMDRSLHTLLTRRLLERYLAACTADARTQLLFTTHDVLLMDQRWLRRDEMWVTERDAAGASSLLSFSEYRDVRYDKDLRKSYLQGRLGGIPRISPTESVRLGAE